MKKKAIYERITISVQINYSSLIFFFRLHSLKLLFNQKGKKWRPWEQKTRKVDAFATHKRMRKKKKKKNKITNQEDHHTVCLQHKKNPDDKRGVFRLCKKIWMGNKNNYFLTP